MVHPAHVTVSNSATMALLSIETVVVVLREMLVRKVIGEFLDLR